MFRQHARLVAYAIALRPVRLRKIRRGYGQDRASGLAFESRIPGTTPRLGRNPESRVRPQDQAGSDWSGAA